MVIRSLFLLGFVSLACAAPKAPVIDLDPAHVDVYVTPYYNSEGPKIDVGSYSAGLASSDEAKFLETISAMKRDWAKLSFAQVYVGSIRLYDLGYRDEAVYWFYTAQYRGRVFASCTDRSKLGSIGSPGFELVSAVGAFQQLVGPYLNAYAFGHLDMLIKTVERVRKEGETVPDLRAIYPGVAFIDEAKWPEQNQGISEGLAKLVVYTKENADDFKSKRAENGTEKKFGPLTSKDLPTGH